MGLFEYRTDGAFAHDLSAREPGHATRLRKQLLAYLQMVTTSVQDNRVWSGSVAPGPKAPPAPPALK